MMTSDDLKERIEAIETGYEFMLAYAAQGRQTDKGAAAGRSVRYRLLRPRTIIYATLIAIIGLVMLGALLMRPTVEVSVLRDRSPIYVTLADGSVRNAYTVKILNKTWAPQDYRLALDGPAARSLDEYVHEWAHPDALALFERRDLATGGSR